MWEGHFPILSVSFPEQDRAHAIGTWSAWTSVFGALGPVAGGWLMQVWSWRLIFLLNLPLVLLIMMLAPRIPESRAMGDGPARPLDQLGATLATLSFAAVIYALSFAPQLGWRDRMVSVPLLAGLVLFALFLGSQSRPNAMMPLTLFRIPRFLAPNLLTFLLYGGLGGSLYVIPFYTIQVRHYAPAAAGAVFVPLILIMFVFSARVWDAGPHGRRAPLDVRRGGARRYWLRRVRLAQPPARIRAVHSASGLAPRLRDDSVRRAAHQRRHVIGASHANRHCLRREQRHLPPRRAPGCLRARVGADPRIRKQPQSPACPFQLRPVRRSSRCGRIGLGCTIFRSLRVLPQGSVTRRLSCSTNHF